MNPSDLSPGAVLLADIARSQLGVHEEPKGSNTGHTVKQYQAATSLGGTGWPWCAAFVSWCVQTAVRTQPTHFPPHFVLPRVSGAFALADSWGKSAGCRVLGPDAEPRIGDVVVFKFSHCGIVVGLNADDGAILCVEGNTDENGGREGWQVALRTRHAAAVRNFVRIPFAA